MARTFDTAVAEVLKNVRMDAAVAEDLALGEGWMNDTIQDVHGRHDWYWAEDRCIVQTVIDKTAGTVSVGASGTAVTGSSTAFDATDVGKFIQFEGSDDWYKITAVASATACTIEGGYNGTSALSAGDYVIRKIFYSMPSTAEKILSVKQAQIPRKVVCIHHKDFDTYLAFSDDTGKASLFCVYGLDSSNNVQFSIQPHADIAYNLEMKFKKKATEDSLEAIPEKWRHVYMEGARFRALSHQALSNPQLDKSLIDRSERRYEQGVIKMIADASPESDYSPVLANRDVQNTLPGPHLPTGLSIPQD
jgi:hypothetical protein